MSEDVEQKDVEQKAKKGPSSTEEKVIRGLQDEIKHLRLRVSSELEDRKWSHPTLIQVLGWLQFFEQSHPAIGTWFPVWLCKIDAWHDAINQGYVVLKTTEVSIYHNTATPVYGLSAKGKELIDRFTQEHDPKAPKV